MKLITRLKGKERGLHDVSVKTYREILTDYEILKISVKIFVLVDKKNIY